MPLLNALVEYFFARSRENQCIGIGIARFIIFKRQLEPVYRNCIALVIFIDEDWLLEDLFLGVGWRLWYEGWRRRRVESFRTKTFFATETLGIRAGSEDVALVGVVLVGAVCLSSYSPLSLLIEERTPNLNTFFVKKTLTYNTKVNYKTLQTVMWNDWWWSGTMCTLLKKNQFGTFKPKTFTNGSKKKNYWLFLALPNILPHNLLNRFFECWISFEKEIKDSCMQVYTFKIRFDFRNLYEFFPL